MNAGGPAFAIRCLEDDDLAEVMAVERACFADPWSEASFRREVARRAVGGYSRVLVDEGAIRAYTVAWFVADEGHLANLAVDPACRRRGMARALVADLLQEAARRQTASVWLEVRAGNLEAIELYRAYGFRPVRIRRGYYRKEREDAIVMVLDLLPEEE